MCNTGLGWVTLRDPGPTLSPRGGWGGWPPILYVRQHSETRVRTGHKSRDPVRRSPSHSTSEGVPGPSPRDRTRRRTNEESGGVETEVNVVGLRTRLFRKCHPSLGRSPGETGPRFEV